MISLPNPEKISKNLLQTRQVFQFRKSQVIEDFKLHLQDSIFEDFQIQLLQQSLEQISDINNIERTSEGLSNIACFISTKPVSGPLFEQDFINYLLDLVINHYAIPPYLVYGLQILSAIVSISDDAANYIVENTPILDLCISKLPLPCSLLFLEAIRFKSEDARNYLREKNITNTCFNIIKKIVNNQNIAIYLLKYISSTIEDLQLTHSDYTYFLNYIAPFCRRLKPTHFQSTCLDFIYEHFSYDMFKALVEIRFCEQFFQNYSQPGPTCRLSKCIELLILVSQVEGDSGNEGACYLVKCGAPYFISRAYSIYEGEKSRILDLGSSIIQMKAPLLNDDFISNIEIDEDDSDVNVQIAEMNFISSLIITGESSYYDYALNLLSPQKMIGVLSSKNEIAIQHILDAFITVLQLLPSHNITKIITSIMDNEDFHSELENIPSCCHDPEIIEKAELLLSLDYE